MPFMMRRPNDEDLEGHEYVLAWYDIRERDFCKEGGAGGIEVGQLRKDLVAGFTAMRKALIVQVDELVGQGDLQEIQICEMLHSQRGMHFTQVALDCAPQDYLMMLLTATSFQCHFLETLACYMYFTKFYPRTLSNDLTNHPVDLSLMGTMTCSLDAAIQLNQLGIPVWLVRLPEAISKMMNVESCIHE